MVMAVRATGNLRARAPMLVLGRCRRTMAAGYAESVSELIGTTPMVKLNRVVPEASVASKVLLKLEMQNPGGSIKDRIALSMIVEAEKRGEIAPGRTTIVEGTSGNTGIGLAMVAAARGYKCIIVMPQVPAMYERYIIDRMYGAEVHLTSVNQNDMTGTINNMLGYVKSLVEENEDYWNPGQFVTADNPLVHYQTTGPEIWSQTGGEVDVFVSGAGTGGTLNGVGRYLTEQNPECSVVCVEPTEARVLVGESPGIHGVVGIGANLELPLLEELAPEQPWAPGPRGVISEFMSASTPEAAGWATRLAAEEGECACAVSQSR